MATQKKVKESAWTEIKDSRREVPGSLRVFSGDGCNTFSHVTAKYSIAERRVVDGRVEFRTREVQTVPVYLKDRCDLHLLFTIAATVYPELEAAAFRRDGGPTISMEWAAKHGFKMKKNKKGS